MDFNRIEKIIYSYNNNNLEHIKKDEEHQYFYKLLLDNKIIDITDSGKIKKSSNNKIYLGKLRVNKNYGFVTTLQNQDFYIKDVSNVLDEDEVLIIHLNNNSSRKNDEAKILAVTKRNKVEEIIRINKRLKCVTLQGSSLEKYEVKIKDENIIKYGNTYVKIKINSVNNFQVEASVQEVIADKNDPDLKMKVVLSKYNITSDFSKEDLEKAEEIASFQIEENEKRVDLRELMTFTIDGADAKDLDDAVSLVKEEENYRLFVSIADVSHYIKEGEGLDATALERSTSVYFIDRVVPMLPKDISNGICSLHPDVNRYTLTCEMVINKLGKVIDSKIYPSIIKSKYKMTYADVNEIIINHNPELIERYSDIYSILVEMNKLAKILQQKRIKRGSFNFEDREPVFKLNEDNDIVDIAVRERKDGEKLIEEFMIVANETVAETISHMDIPFVYRVHGQPTEEKIRDLQKVFPLFGVLLKGNEQDFHTLSFITALDSLEDELAKRVLSDMIIRSLQKAYYSTNNIGHFGLASSYYTHFTSPIRRYPDLIVHRLLRKYLFDKNYDSLERLMGRLNYISEYTSEKEVKAIKAEQEIENQKKTEYMKRFINQEFIGIVASITDFGFFVELENTIRGLIKYNQLEGFVESKNFTIILKNRKKIKVGEKIKIRLVAVNIDKGLVDFEPIDYAVKKEKNENYRNKQKSKIRLSTAENPRSRNRTKRKRNKVNKGRTS